MEEERAGDTDTDASTSEALAARTRALVEESRALLRRLEELLEHGDTESDDDEGDVADRDDTRG